MKYLNSFNQINEAGVNAQNDDKPNRSERLLTQAQREYQDTPEMKQKTGPMPAMVFTDVVGSSDMWADDPISMAKQLEGHHKLVDSIAGKNKGWIVKTIGDAFMVYFEPSQDSLYNAIKFSKEVILNENNYNLRVGVCSGPMDEKTYRLQNVDLRDFYGNSVNTASRMESKVSQKGGTIAFCSINPIENKMSKIQTLGKVLKVDLSKFDLKGAKVDKAYTMSVK